MHEQFIKRLDLLTQKLSVLPDKSEETPFNTLNALWSTAAGHPISVKRANDYLVCELSDIQNEYLDDLIDKRIQGLPLAYLTGRQSFMNMEMIARKDALIPRKETELLATNAIRIAKEFAPQNIYVLDVCTGAGNIALSIAKYCDNTTVYASDLSEDAVGLARDNSSLLNLEKRISFYSGDLLKPFETLGLAGKVSLITCNPPYISTSKVSEMPEEISAYEPKLAFDGGAFGVNLIKRLVTESNQYLVEDGYLLFEAGFGQAMMIRKLVEKTNLFRSFDTVNDEFGNPRVIWAKK
jgi:release factor glutamine methyltransferase